MSAGFTDRALEKDADGTRQDDALRRTLLSLWFRRRSGLWRLIMTADERWNGRLIRRIGWRSDCEAVLAIQQSRRWLCCIPHGVPPLGYASADLQADREVVLAAVQMQMWEALDMEVQMVIVERVFESGDPYLLVLRRLSKRFLCAGATLLWRSKTYQRAIELVQAVPEPSDFVRGATGVVIDHVRLRRRNFPIEPYAALLNYVYKSASTFTRSPPSPRVLFMVALGLEDGSVGVSVAPEIIRDARLCPDDEDRVITMLSKLFHYLDQSSALQCTASPFVKELLTRR